MLRGVYEVMCAIRRKRTIVGIAATAIPLVVILVLLEISYRELLARELSETFTGSLPSSVPVGPRKLQFEPDYPRWTPLAQPIVPLAPPSLAAEAESSSTRQSQSPIASRESPVASRDPVPLPRSRPNRL